MKNLRVLTIALAIALSTFTAASVSSQQHSPEIGAGIGALASGGDLHATGQGAVIGGIAGGIIGGIAGFFIGGVGAVPGAEIGIAVGGL